MNNRFTIWHVGVAAEALTAYLFARYGFDVSGQYGASQPEYDLIVASGERLLKVSVKGSQDGGWCLCQGDTILYVRHTRGGRALAAGTTEAIPSS